MTYHHEQAGRVYVAFGLLLVVPLVIGILARAPLLVWLTVVLAFIYWAFARLRIDVEGTDASPKIRWSMTFGWPGGCIPIADVAGVEIVPVTFWMGIGIHLRLRGWIWNVALGKGVRIVKRTGSDVILGTDEPQELLTAIQRVR